MILTTNAMHLFFLGVAITGLFIIISFKMLWYMMGTFIEAPAKEMHYTILVCGLDIVVFILMLIPFIYQVKGYPVPAQLSFWAWIPLPIWYLYGIASCALTMHVRHLLVQWRRTHVTYKTWHQALDNLPMGICVYDNKGILELTNYQMQNLCRRYTGEPLLNGVTWENTISALPNLMLSFSQDEVWHFKKLKKDNNSTVLTATDVSAEMKLNRELQIENLQLENMNNRMRQYGLDLEDIIKQEELLNAQIRVHDELGHILLTSKVFMNGSDFAISEEQLRKEWKQQLLSMKDFKDTASDDSQTQDLIKAAKTLGIDIVVDGSLPTNQTLRHLMASAARECLTNAAKVGAENLWIRITKSGKNHSKTTIAFTNDGKPAAGPIREGVGLGTLRQIVEREGATMTITTDGGFCLSIEM